MEIVSQSKLEGWQKADAERLMRVWKKFQAKEEMNQDEAADSLGWLNQSAFSQYLNGVIALNLKAVIAFARFFGVAPKEISPTFADMLGGVRETGNPNAVVLERIAEDHRAGKLSDDDLLALEDFAEYRKSKRRT